MLSDLGIVIPEVAPKHALACRFSTISRKWKSENNAIWFGRGISNTWWSFWTLWFPMMLRTCSSQRNFNILEEAVNATVAKKSLTKCWKKPLDVGFGFQYVKKGGVGQRFWKILGNAKFDLLDFLVSLYFIDPFWLFTGPKIRLLANRALAWRFLMILRREGSFFTTEKILL